MTTFLTFLVGAAMLATVVTLARGIRSLLTGGDPRRSNKLMQNRVMFQAVALALVAIVILLNQHSR